MLIIRKARRNMSYKNRRYGLTSLEKMNIKSMCEKIETLCNISNLTETNKLDKLIKGMCNIYMETIIADDSSPRTRVKKRPLYTFDQVDPDTSYIFFYSIKGRSSSITSGPWTRWSRRECATR